MNFRSYLEFGFLLPLCRCVALFYSLLGVKSSYSREIEMALENAQGVRDTLQWLALV
jgi:hypothetical protein